MSLDLALVDLAAWSVQVGALTLAAAVVGRLAPVERPAARLALGQALLLAALALPLLQPWRTLSASVMWSTSAARAVAPGGTGRLLGDGSTLAAGWPEKVFALLLLGALVQLARLALGFARLRALARACRPFEAPPWLAALRSATAPRAAFVVSDAAAGPATFGIRRPTVLLPPGFETMSRERRQAIALHELLHVERGDWVAQTCEELLRAVLFFHPAVHWLVARVRLAREQTVDAEVVRRLGSRDAYLDSLVAMARRAVSLRAVPAAPFLHESHLRERVDLLLKEVFMSRRRTAIHVALTAGLVALSTAWAATAFPLQAAKPASGPNVNIAEDTNERDLKLVHKVNPAYPAAAKAEKVEGVFAIDVVIGKDGAIRDARVVASAPTPERLKANLAQKGDPAAVEGDPRLAEAAIAAVKQWRYQPIRRDGKPVEAKATVTVRFLLA